MVVRRILRLMIFSLSHKRYEGDEWELGSSPTRPRKTETANEDSPNHTPIASKTRGQVSPSIDFTFLALCAMILPRMIFENDLIISWVFSL